MYKIRKCIYDIVYIGIFLMLFLMSNIVALGEEEKVTEYKEFEYIFSINNISHSGIYYGETLNGYPHGRGCFTTDELSTYTYRYEGEFAYGKFEGEGIVYINDRRLECEFLEGLPVGRGNLYNSDGSYRGIRFSKGVPYGITATYSNASEYLDYDFYYNGELIKLLKENAIAFDYGKLYRNEEDYIGKIIKVSCTVLYVYEGKKECIFRVGDRDGNIYWGKYENREYKQFNQSIMPTLKVGDEIELYAFFYGLTEYIAENDLFFSKKIYPELKVIQGETRDFSVDRDNPSFDYNEVLRFPYSYYKKRNNINGVVSAIVENDTKNYYFLSDENENIYVISLESSLNEKIIWAPGDEITITGEYLGLYKEKKCNSEDYQLYVYLKTIKIIED